MSQLDHQKVSAHHLRRDAYLYVRQSSLRQVLENTESTVRQYALRDRAVALGWPLERIVVVDGDQGQSGASSAGRTGFQQLVAEVGLGRVGIVLGLEVSRLARNNSDWHRLLEICGLTETLILDEDGVYDPASFNDRLLLGLKGTMSEAELHVLRARLRGGVLNKARRGALRLPLPIGLAYREDGTVVLDPDGQIQQAVRHFFETFARTGSATATVRYFREHGLLFPHRIRSGAHRGEVIWQALLHSQALDLVHNPRYAGAFVYGRRHVQHLDGHLRVTLLPRDQWIALFPGSHEGYISWEQYEANQRRLRDNIQPYASDREVCPPREGPALLQGLALCGRCGARLGVHYHQRRGRLIPDYVCQHRTIQEARLPCQVIPGGVVDAAISALLVQMVTPEALQIALDVQAEVVARADEVDRLRQLAVDRAHYEADLAQRRFLRVDPEHRLVADVLEAEWNAKLRLLAEAQDHAERQRQTAHLATAEERAAVLALATDFPRLWAASGLPHRERKRLVRLLITDVTMHRDAQITLQIRFAGGATQTLRVPAPPVMTTMRATDATIVAEIDRLLDHSTEADIATQLNARGWRSREGKRFDARIVRDIRRRHHLQDRFTRLRAAGLLTVQELAQRLHVCPDTVQRWRERGLLHAERYNSREHYLYPIPDATLPAKWRHKPQRHEPALELSNGGAL